MQQLLLPRRLAKQVAAALPRPQAKPYQRSDYSHSPAELMKIGYENEVLVKKLTGISAQPPARWVEDLKR